MRILLPLPARSRHPFVQALSLLLGVVLLGIVLVFGAAVLAVMVVVGAAVFGWRRWQRARMPAPTRPQPAAHRPDVLEGEFVVVRSGRTATH